MSQSVSELVSKAVPLCVQCKFRKENLKSSNYELHGTKQLFVNFYSKYYFVSIIFSTGPPVEYDYSLPPNFSVVHTQDTKKNGTPFIFSHFTEIIIAINVQSVPIFFFLFLETVVDTEYPGN